MHKNIKSNDLLCVHNSWPLNVNVFGFLQCFKVLGITFNGSLETGDLLMPVSQTKKRGCRKVECEDQSTGFPSKEM